MSMGEKAGVPIPAIGLNGDIGLSGDAPPCIGDLSHCGVNELGVTSAPSSSMENMSSWYAISSLPHDTACSNISLSSNRSNAPVPMGHNCPSRIFSEHPNKSSGIAKCAASNKISTVSSKDDRIMGPV